MRYWTKDWFELSQQIGLHFGLRAHKLAAIHDENLYKRLYKRKEKEFIHQQREIYNVDPRIFLEMDGMNTVPLHKIHNEEEIVEEDIIVHHMSRDERRKIEEKIAEYDARPPFDEAACKQAFREQLEWKCKYAASQLPQQLLSQIADIRVYALGYCTKEVLEQLKCLSKENNRKVNEATEMAINELRQQNIPDSISSKLNFHDCIVTSIDCEANVVITFDPSGGFTRDNRITLVEAEVIIQDDIIGNYWLYNELYRAGEDYELHVLLQGRQLNEMIIRCKDIVIDQYECT